jgi:hypothetical protein
LAVDLAVDPPVAVADLAVDLAVDPAAGSVVDLAVDPAAAAAVDPEFDPDLVFDHQRMTNDSMLDFGCSHYSIVVAAEDSHSPEIAGWGSAVLVVIVVVVIVVVADLDVRNYFHSGLLLDSVAGSDRLCSSVVHCYYYSRPG